MSKLTSFRLAFFNLFFYHGKEKKNIHFFSELMFTEKLVCKNLRDEGFQFIGP